MHNKYHLYDVHRACASYSMRHLFVSFSFIFLFFLFFFSFSFFFFSLASSLCQQLYKITIWDSAHNICSESTRYQMWISQAIIRGSSLNRCLLLAKIVGFTKECKWGEVAECLYLSSTIFTLYCWILPCSRNLDGVDSMNHVDDDVELRILFETS